jgi:hypothetical protein
MAWRVALIGALALGIVALAGAPAASVRPALGPQAAPSLQVQQQLGGAANALAFDAGRAYVGVGQRLLVLDARSPLAPTVLGTSEVLRGLVMGVTVRDSTVYAALGTAGLAILDVSNPAAPRLASYLGGNVSQVVPDGSRLYLVGGTTGVRIVDAANPAVDLGVFGGFVTDLAANGNLAYTVARNLVLWDVTNPAAANDLRELSNWADAVTVRGVTLYGAVSEDAGNGQRKGYVQTWDMTNIRRPVVLGRVPTAGQARFARLEGEELWVLSDSQLERFDARDPVQLPRLGSSPALQAAQEAVKVADQAYLAAGAEGLRAVPLAGGNPPEGQRLLALPGRPESLALDEARLYVEDADQRVLIYDRNDVAAGPIGQFPAAIESGALVAEAGILYLGTPDRKLRILDARDPSAVRQLAELSFGQMVARIAVADGYAYLATDPYLRVLDVRNPAAPTTVGQMIPTGGVTDLALGGHWLFVVGPNTGIQPRPSLKSIDVSYPPNPRERALIGAVSATSGIATADDLVYVSALQVVEACRPAVPYELARLQTPGRTRSLATDGWRVFAAKSGLLGGGELKLFDLHVPAHPVEAASLPLADSVDGVVAAEGHFWASARDSGLIVGLAPEVYRPTPTPNLSQPTPTRPPGLTASAFLPYVRADTPSRPCPAR